MNSSEIKMYQVEGGQTEIEVKLYDETVWLSQKQMAELFDKDTDTIGLHLKNIYKSTELLEDATTEESSVVQIEGNRRVKRKLKFYNLDAIISVGYRVNSKRGTQFRIWANKVLRDYLIKGYSINEKKLKLQADKLKELQNTVKIIGSVLDQKRLSGDEGAALLKLISDYSYALELLDQYDYQKLEIPKGKTKETYQITYAEANKLINKVRSAYNTTELFGQEKDRSFESSISTIYQTHDGQDLYPTLLLKKKLPTCCISLQRTIHSLMEIKE
jgi:hypothetical protein